MGRLFYDDEFEAIRASIESGKGYKATATFLWPTMKPESAYARLKACTNSHGDQHLRYGEVVALMRFNGTDDALMWACDETDHDRPARRAPADKVSELVAEFNRQAESLKGLASQIERAGGVAALRKVA